MSPLAPFSITSGLSGVFLPLLDFHPKETLFKGRNHLRSLLSQLFTPAQLLPISSQYFSLCSLRNTNILHQLPFPLPYFFIFCLHRIKSWLYQLQSPYFSHTMAKGSWGDPGMYNSNFFPEDLAEGGD